jgi:hypothetical protein
MSGFDDSSIPVERAVIAQKVDRSVQFGEGAFEAAEALSLVVRLDRRGAGFKIVARDLFQQVNRLI